MGDRNNTSRSHEGRNRRAAGLDRRVCPRPHRRGAFYAHRKTAEIADANVSPEVRAKIRRLLRSEKALGQRPNAR